MTIGLSIEKKENCKIIFEKLAKPTQKRSVKISAICGRKIEGVPQISQIDAEEIQDNWVIDCEK